LGFATGIADSSGNGAIYKTIDGGETWTDIVSQLPDVVKNKALFETTKELSDYLYVGGNLSTFLLYNRITDTWTNISKGTSHNAYDLYAFSNSEVISMTSLRASADYILRTTNSGDTWTEPATAPQDKTLTGFDFYGNTGIAITCRNATTYKLYKTTDKGITWSEISTSVFGYDCMQSISYASATIIYIAGCTQTTSDGRLWKSINGGTTWTDISDNLGWDTPKLNCVKFYDELNGWIGTSLGKVLYTTDGGTSWTSVDANVNNKNVNDIMLI
jgi:photosystem II stability/assembly factor-like uncharacterized protein